MIVEQIYTGCLAQGAYYILSDGEAAIIDPLREVTPYIKRAEKDNAKIKYVFETHFHADFVSGHVTLSEKTGAPIVYGPNANPEFKAHVAKDGELFKIGKATIKVLHTPGHTMESTTFLLLNEEGKEEAIFTGDTLFLGDVGRPDLAQKTGELTKEDLAGYLFDSLRDKIMPLPDEITVYPGHGAGSACGKNMMKETVDSLGNQKKMNYALRSDMTKDEFVKEVTDGLIAPPGYFPMNVQLNRQGYASIDDVLDSGLKSLNPDAFETIANEAEALILDVRSQEEFVKSHIPNSIFIGLDGNFAQWVGELIVDVKQPILLVAPEGREEEAVTRLARVGFDHTLGVLDGGIDAWKANNKETSQIESIDAKTFEQRLSESKLPVIDVRKSTEFAAEHVEDAINTPLASINEHLAEIPGNQFFIHCKGGYRSVIASSILKARGIHNMIDVKGGYDAIENTGIKTTDYVCPSTLNKN